MSHLAVIGTTSWGTTLALTLARQGHEVRLWARTPEEAERLERDRENKAMLPGFPFPAQLRATHAMSHALGGAALVVFAVPSPTMRANLRLARDHISPASLVLSAAKGVELPSRLLGDAPPKRMSQVMAEELPEVSRARLCVISGPNLSLEIARGLPATTVVASEEAWVAEAAQGLLMAPNFRVYTNTDVVGVELGGALKNIIALGAGMADGLGYGDNAKAAFMTRGLAEIARLGVAAGANPLTFAGLAGMGDLIATCASGLSRNHYVGLELARGRPLKDVLATLKSPPEGINTTVAARQMARELQVEMPITEQMYRVLFEGQDVRQAVAELMGRKAKPELAGLAPGPGRRLGD